MHSWLRGGRRLESQLRVDNNAPDRHSVGTLSLVAASRVKLQRSNLLDFYQMANGMQSRTTGAGCRLEHTVGCDMQVGMMSLSVHSAISVATVKKRVKTDLFDLAFLPL